MSNQRKQKRHRVQRLAELNRGAELRQRARARAARLQQQDHAVVVGWCDGSDDAVEEAKRLTHDAVIELLGDRRTGGVGWQIHDETAQRVLDDLVVGAGGQAERDHYRQLRGMLREFGGCIVVAHAPGIRS